MTPSSPIRRFLWLALLLVLVLPRVELRASETIYGSGDFVLNEGPVYSDSGNYIGSLTKWGSGSVTFGASNVYTGGTIVTGGTLTLNNGGILIGGTINTTGATLQNGTGFGSPHSISVTAVNGTVSKFPDLSLYSYGTSVTLSAVADPGFVFSNWTSGSLGGGSSSQSSITIFAYADYEFVAHFVPISRVISLNGSTLGWSQTAVGDSGTAPFTIENTGNSPLNVSGITYPAGFSGNWTGQIAPGGSHTVNVTFSPLAAGTHTGSVSVQSDATAGTASLVIAATAEDVYTLSGTSSFSEPYADFFGDYALHTIPLQRKYWKGSVVNLQARPVDGYVFINWTENGNVLSTAPNFDLNMQRTHDVWANYEIISPSVAISGVPNMGARKIRSVTRRIFRLSNTGNVPIFIAGLHISNRGPRTRVFTGNWSGWLQPGEVQAVPISFRPLAKTTYVATITPILGDLSTASDEMRIKGSGL